MTRTGALHAALQALAAAAGLPTFEHLDDLANGPGLIVEVPVPPLFATLIQHARVELMPYGRDIQGVKVRWVFISGGAETRSPLGDVNHVLGGELAWRWRVERPGGIAGSTPYAPTDPAHPLLAAFNALDSVLGADAENFRAALTAHLADHPGDRW